MKNIIFPCFLLFALSACENTKETLGLKKQAPDEFAVVKRAPLALPPDYSLRPPQPGAPRPQEQAMSEQAAVAVFGGEKSAVKNAPTSAEGALLQQAGAQNVDPEIRQKVDYETSTRVDENKPVIDKLLSIGSDEEDVPAEVVDAKAEAERLRKNQEEGKPVTEGETPSIGN